MKRKECDIDNDNKTHQDNDYPQNTAINVILDGSNELASQRLKEYIRILEAESVKDKKTIKRDKEMLVDDNETAEDLLITDMTSEELDAEYERIFGKQQNND